MKSSEIYFERNLGSWDWKIDFKITSFRALWSSNLSVLVKLRLSAFAIAQSFFGQFKMWSNVEFSADRSVVHHTTKSLKWGFTFYRSEKDFGLDEDGQTLHVTGVEYFWPFMFIPVAFAASEGRVDESTKHAAYKMPLAGTTCDCKAFLDRPEGYFAISTPWLEGKISLIGSSIDKLAARLKASS